MSADWQIINGELQGASLPVLTGLHPKSELIQTELLPEETSSGAFLQLTADKAASTLIFPLGDLSHIRRFTSCHRYEPFWMTPKAGTRGGEVAKETQYLLCEREDGSILLLVPLPSGAFHVSLEGNGENGLLLIAESGDDTIISDSVVGLFIAEGPEPFALLKASAEAVASHLKTGRLNSEKPVPAFVDQFGWCTWDAFYQDVSHEKVREGLESFQNAGVMPRYLILDDGWQSVKPFPTGEKRLTSFAANEKFPGDLAPTVRMAKEEYDLETFLVWHAVSGYWGGVDGDSLPGYGVRSTPRQYSPTIHEYAPKLRDWFGYACGTVDTTQIYRFYQDYHRHLRRQGVDGVKVDNQASLESLTHGGGYGGRAGIMQTYHEALEGSVQTQFMGNLINCMSCANEMFYGLLNSTITRTSTDFWPNRPESHGLHLYCNAQVSAWFGEFALPDWDMFQSGHPAGAFHAAGRALSGGPIYVSDKPDAHNVELLKKLVLADGSVLRCDSPGRPTRDCLFHDPTRDDVLLKIFNFVQSDPWSADWNGWDEAAMIGVFHARYGEGVGAISGTVSPSDIPNWAQDDFQYAVYSHYGQELSVLACSESRSVTLEPLTAEIFTLTAVWHGFAPIGIAELFNSYGAIAKCVKRPDQWSVDLLSAGTFIAYSEARPSRVALDGIDSKFAYDSSTGKLTVSIPVSEEQEGEYTLTIYS